MWSFDDYFKKDQPRTLAFGYDDHAESCPVLFI